MHSLYNVAPTDPRSFDKGGHSGVMSLFYIAVAVKKDVEKEGAAVAAVGQALS